MMFQVYKRFFPNIAVGYEDPRVNVHICDGMIRHLICLILPSYFEVHYYISLCLIFAKHAGVKFMQSVPEGTYDAIILDAFVSIGIFSFLISEVLSYSNHQISRNLIKSIVLLV